MCDSSGNQFTISGKSQSLAATFFVLILYCNKGRSMVGGIKKKIIFFSTRHKNQVGRSVSQLIKSSAII